MLGQLAYLSPVLAVATGWAVVRLVRRRDRAEAPLVVACVAPLAVLSALSAWSRASEPHWIAPAFLSVALAHARSPLVPLRLARWSVAIGVATIALAHLWILTDLPPRLLGRLYQPKYDLTNDLRAWPPVCAWLESAPPISLIVAPHWTVAAQLHACLPGVEVVTVAGRDDFARWAGGLERARDARGLVLWVSDDRFFDVRPTGEREVVVDHTAALVRAGRVVRRVHLVGTR